MSIRHFIASFRADVGSTRSDQPAAATADRFPVDRLSGHADRPSDRHADCPVAAPVVKGASAIQAPIKSDAPANPDWFELLKSALYARIASETRIEVDELLKSHLGFCPSERTVAINFPSPCLGRLTCRLSPLTIALYRVYRDAKTERCAEKGGPV